MKNKIVGYRKMLGFTQVDIAKIFDISVQAYWNKRMVMLLFLIKKRLNLKIY